MKLVNHTEFSPNHQADAVLAYLRYAINDGIEGSWDQTRHDYLAEPEVVEWYNGRERGYVVFMKSRTMDRQINIAFYEHRGSDSICVLSFEALTFNPPTLANLPDGHPYVSSSSGLAGMFKVGEAMQAGDLIAQMLKDFWNATK